MTYPTALKKIWGRPRHKQTHTHTQYTLFDECIALGPNVVSPLAGRTGWPQRHSRRVRTPHPPHAPAPPTRTPQSVPKSASSHKRRGRGGAQCPPRVERAHSIRAPRRVRDLSCCAQKRSAQGLRASEAPRKGGPGGARSPPARSAARRVSGKWEGWLGFTCALCCASHARRTSLACLCSALRSSAARCVTACCSRPTSLG